MLRIYMKRCLLASVCLVFLIAPMWALAATLDVGEGYTYTTIQSAINAAVSSVDDVLVHDGTYVEQINFLGKAISVTSVNGADYTVIDGNQAGSVVTFSSGEGSGSILEGFTIRNGKADNTGGGILCVSSSPTIVDCVIKENEAGNWGAGVYCYSSSPTFTRCVIQENSAGYGGAAGGGGMYITSSSNPVLTDCIITLNEADPIGGNSGTGGGVSIGGNSSPIFNDCTITDNVATSTSSVAGGGGIIVALSTPQFIRCVISGNYVDGAYGLGGAMYNNMAATVATNCIITGNAAVGTSYSQGGAIYSTQDYRRPVFTNCTISGNSAGTSGGGVHVVANGSMTLVNSIVWGNQGGQISGGVNTKIYYSDIQGGWSGTGSNNINSDPLFADPLDGSYAPISDGDYHLQEDSPCIDAGTDNSVLYPQLPDDDIDGDGRPQNGEYDIGADEYL